MNCINIRVRTCLVMTILKCPIFEAILKALIHNDVGSPFPVVYLIAVTVAFPREVCGMCSGRCNSHVVRYRIIFGGKVGSGCPSGFGAAAIDSLHLHKVSRSSIQIIYHTWAGDILHLSPGFIFRIETDVVDLQIVLAFILVTNGKIAFLTCIFTQVDGYFCPYSRSIAGLSYTFERTDILSGC